MCQTNMYTRARIQMHMYLQYAVARTHSQNYQGAIAPQLPQCPDFVEASEFAMSPKQHMKT